MKKNNQVIYIISNTRFILAISFIAILLNSCSKYKSEASLVEDYVLTPVVIDFKGKEIINPNSISILGNSLLVVERGVNTEIFNFYSLDDFKFLNSYGHRGRGPNEFSEIIQNPVSLTGKSTPHVDIFDWINKRLTRLISDPQSHNHFFTDQHYVLPPELMLAQRATFLNDTTVISSGGTNRGHLSYCNISTDECQYINHYSVPDGKFSPRSIAELFRGEFAINYDSESIVYASKWIPEILILDFSGQISKRIPLFEYHLDDILMTAEDDRKLYYKDIKVTEYAIYAVYIEKSFNDLIKILDNLEDNSHQIISEIHVFNWNGDIQMKYRLQGGFYQFIEIDESNGRFLSINATSSDREIVQFDYINGL